MPWRKNPTGDPKVMEAGLREAAIPLAALACTVPLAPEHTQELTQLVRAGADWLLARQHFGGGSLCPSVPRCIREKKSAS